jgi:hypothetical protein
MNQRCRRLARQPERTVRRLCSLGAGVGIVVGVSKVEPSKRDRRFADAGWSESPVLRCWKRVIRDGPGALHGLDPRRNPARLQ